jgi:hypothetical protein
VEGVNINNCKSVKDYFMIQYRGIMETTTFCHQVPKLVQAKTKTVSDFGHQCITEMRKFINFIQAQMDALYTAAYFNSLN